MALTVLGVIGLVVLLLCGGVVGAGWWAYSSIADTVEQAKARARQRSSSGPSIRPPFSPPSPSFSSEPPPKSVTEAIAALSSNDRRRLEQAAEYLASAPVDSSRRSAVCTALARKLTFSSTTLQRKLMTALAKWKGSESVPELVEALKNRRIGDHEALRQAFALLGKSQDSQSAEAIAFYLQDNFVGDAAAAALKEIGPTAQGHVAAYIDHPIAGRRARDVLSSYGTDAEAALLTARVAALQKDPQGAARWLASAEVVPEQQVTVARALDAALAANKNAFQRQELLRAIKVWGDKQSLKDVAPLLSDHFCRDEALAVFVAVNDPASAEVLTPLLRDFFVGDGVARALQKMGPDVKPYVLEYLNDRDGRARERAKSILTELGATNDDLLAQTVKDLKSVDSERQRAALGALSQIEVAPAHQAAVAEELVRLSNVGDRRTEDLAKAALAHWGTAAQAPQMLGMLASRDRRMVEVALNNLLAMDDPKVTPGLTQEVGRLIKDNFMRGIVLIALNKAGPKAEDVLIGLLEPQFTPDVIAVAVQNLTNVGTEKSLAPLSRLVENARKFRNPALVAIANSAQAAIRKRLAENEEQNAP